ncbi:MAG: transcriptional repressor LexA [Cyanobacteria bacterium]|nr:transcriptional repressor LexA [Cyanobacteriota bacterium]
MSTILTYVFGRIQAGIMKQLPPRQQDVINAILQLTNEHGYPPTLAELAAALGLKNRMTVHQHVAALKRKGLVNWESGLNRSLRVLNEGLSYVTVPRESGATVAATNNTIEIDHRSDPHANGAGVELKGRIAAGSPIDAIENPEYLGMESDYAKRGCYALQVSGDSMIDDGILDGDFVIIKPNPSPRNGEIVVALLEDGTATLKRFFKENGRYRLQPANATMDPIFVDGGSGLDIQGVVVGLFRRM